MIPFGRRKKPAEPRKNITPKEAEVFHKALFPGEEHFRTARNTAKSNPSSTVDANAVALERAEEMVRSGFGRWVLPKKKFLRRRPEKIFRLTLLGHVEMRINEFLWATPFSEKTRRANPLSRESQGRRDIYSELLVIREILSREFDPRKGKLVRPRVPRLDTVQRNLAALARRGSIIKSFQDQYGKDSTLWSTRVRKQYMFLIQRTFLAKEAHEWLTKENWEKLMSRRLTGAWLTSF